MKPNAKCRPTTEGDRVATKEINVRKKRNWWKKKFKQQSVMRNCARIIYGNMPYLNDDFSQRSERMLTDSIPY